MFVKKNPNSKKNEFRALFYVVITWTVTYALGIPLIYCVGIISILIASGIVADLGVRIVTPRKCRPELWIAVSFYVFSVIVGIFATHANYDSTQHSIVKSTGCIIKLDFERLALHACGYLTFLALRCIQVFLMVFVTAAMINPEKPEVTKKDSPGGEMKDERSENSESEAAK